MDEILKKSTKDADLLKLGEIINDPQLILFLCKSLPGYPEYIVRIDTARNNAISESKVYKYPEAYAKAFVEYRVDLELGDIRRDRLSAFQLLEAKLLFNNGDVLRSKEFIKLHKEIKALERFFL